MIELTDHEGRLITVQVRYEAGTDNHEAIQSVFRMLEVARIRAPNLFSAGPAIVADQSKFKK
jgi:hypothetical protein